MTKGTESLDHSREVTRPDSPGVRGLTIEEVIYTVVGRIKTAFAPIGKIDDPETLRKAEWVVAGLDKWGYVEDSGRDTSAADVDGAAK